MSESVPHLLARAARSDLAAYDPGAVVLAVNALVPLGRDAALAAIEAAAAAPEPAGDPRHGLFFVLRVAFDADPHPPIRLGATHPAAPTDPAALPRFPIVLVDDLPLLLISSFTLRGLPEPLSAHVDYYRAHGRLRAAPLAPAPALDRASAAEARYRAAYGEPAAEDTRAQLRDQLTRWQNARN